MYTSHLSGLIGKLVRVNRGGPESSEGIVLAVKSDYIVIFAKHEGVVYFNREHIKSITILHKPHKHSEKHGHHHRVIRWKHRKPSSFLDALRSKKNHLIKINRGGPESIVGVLSQVNADYITLIVNHESIIIFTQHIKSFTPSVRLLNQYKGEHNKGQKQGKDEKGGKDNREHKDGKDKDHKEGRGNDHKGDRDNKEHRDGKDHKDHDHY